MVRVFSKAINKSPCNVFGTRTHKSFDLDAALTGVYVCLFVYLLLIECASKGNCGKFKLLNKSAPEIRLETEL